jgi:hypothetical protein
MRVRAEGGAILEVPLGESLPDCVFDGQNRKRTTRCAVNPAAQLDLAQRLSLTAYDAAYLQLALDLGAPLATFDRRLGLAAGKALA